MPFYQATKRVLLFGSVSTPVFLPTVGPFAGLGNINAASKPNATISGTLNTTSTNTRTTPLMYNNLIINGGALIQADLTTTAAVFILANTITFKFGFSTIDVSGTNGRNGDCSSAGNGGSGGSGGGGGGSIGNCCFCPCVFCFSAAGGAGGSGDYGTEGSEIYNGTPGGRGAGFGLVNDAGFNYPSGGSSSNGTGGLGFGGGGDGGSCSNFYGSNAGGGGGGGGLIVIVANTIFKSGGAGCSASSNGGLSANGNGCASTQSFGGGGGAIYAAARHYDGSIGVSVSGVDGGQDGNTLNNQILADNTLVGKTFSQVW